MIKIKDLKFKDRIYKMYSDGEQEFIVWDVKGNDQDGWTAVVDWADDPDYCKTINETHEQEFYKK